MRILIVDDNEAVRRGIRSLLATRPDFSVCGEAADGVQAIEKSRELRPDVVLMDLSMPRMGGLEAIRIIRPELPQCEFISVSQNDPALVREQAASVGVQCSIAKSDLPRELLPTIDRISAARSKAGQWPAGGGEMGAIMRSTDWSKTPLGPVESWSPALRMMVPFLLANRFPQLLWWGTRFCCLYNDAYIPVLGEKHPWALGRPTEEVWHEIWHVLRPLIETPFRGGPATWMEDLPVEINRKGFVEETHFTIAYSPVPDETAAGGIGGVLATVHEITAKVIGDRRVVTLRDLGARSGEPKTVQEALTLASEILARHPKDLPFVLFYLLDDKLQTTQLVSCAGVDPNEAGVLRTIELASQHSSPGWPFSAALETEEIQFVSALEDKFRCVPRGPWSDPPTTAAVVPVRSNIAHQLVGFIVAGVSARLQFDESYCNFLELLSTQISTMVANARAYEEERKRAEALAEIDRAKTAFFSNVSHEFRTPLTLMMGPLEDAIAESEGLSGPNRERLELAHRNSLRLLKLVNTLLDFSRIEAGRIQASYELTDLSHLTAELASVFRSAIERAGMRLVIDCPGLPKNVYVDREMWEKIVLNLLSNAFKFTFEGEIAVSLRAVDSAVELGVRDSGTGIPAEEIPRLFERFHRVKGARGRSYEGSGIGLALVQELVKLHGGSISVESKVNQGTVFTVTIPLGKNHLPADRIGGPRTLASTGLHGDAYLQEALRWLTERQAVAEEVPVGSTLLAADVPPPSFQECQERSRILLADDNADMREYVQRLLCERYEVAAVADGEAALQRAREQRPDLILSDIMMPKLDGFALLRAVRAEEDLKSIPMILLSARAGEESRVEGLDAGADDYLVKPFSARELLARVGSHLAMARIRREAAELERKLRTEAESEVRQRTKELEEKTADVLRQSEQLRELSWRLLHTQDEERRHIARELHDSAGQTLAVLGMMISSVVEMARPKIPEVADSAKEIHEVVQQLTKEIRTTSYLLHPPLLDENGLPPALSWYLRGLTERSGMDIGFYISEEFGRLPRDMELVVFRVVQECLTNVHRHSGSKNAAIWITRETDRVLVEVRDEGKGISPERLAEIQSKGSGVGIRGMRERLRQFQGEMIIQSGGAGTTVLVTIPLNAATDPVQPTDSFESAI
ncbi:MAG: response regulator [Candidatus Acidiferrales bacterium]